MRSAWLVTSLTLAACTAPAPLPADESAKLDLATFFVGRSQGEGELRILLQSPVGIKVHSVGRRQRDGTLILDQVTSKGGDAPRRRRWIMRPIGPNRFAGTLSDAAGPVDARTKGPRATIRYRMKNGMAVEQKLALQRDGRTLLNQLEVRRFGVRVASLRETIRKLD